MRNWEPQQLPGILEDVSPMSVPLSPEGIARVSELLRQLSEVDMPDWLDRGPSPDSIYAVHLALDYWRLIIDNMDRKLVRRAFDAEIF